MSILTDKMKIAQAICRGMLRYDDIRNMKKFVIIDEYNSRFGFFVIASSDNGTFGFEVIDSLDICERYSVMQLVRCCLESDGYKPLVIYVMPTHFTKIPMDSLDTAEPNVPEQKADEEEQQPVANKPSDEITDHITFFRAVYLTPEQQRRVQAELPAGVPTDELRIFTYFGDDVLRQCGLKRVQLAAWKTLLAKQRLA